MSLNKDSLFFSAETDGVQFQVQENGVDNQAFDLEDGNTDTNGSNSQTKGTKKGLGSYLSQVSKPLNATEDYIKKHREIVQYVVLGILGAGYVAYFIAACLLDFQRAIALVVLTSLAIVIKSYELLKQNNGGSIKCFSPAVKCFKSNLKWLKWVFILAVVALLVLFLAFDKWECPEELIPLGAHRTEVSWRPVFWGLGLQFCIGLFVIRTTPGNIAFQWLGNQVQIFLDYTKEGSRFVFGDLIDNIFAFQALPIVVFFSSVMSILYYLGIMQWVILKISWVMQITLGTSPTETLSVAGNIFVGQTEAPLLIRPYLIDMTKSEIHAVMTGGFATVAGSVMGAFISFGIDASSLLSASVMAAPCALAISKLSYPETEESLLKSETSIKVFSGDEENILEAASSGASASIGLVANIAANLIAFLAVLGFINKALSWFGSMLGHPDITFEMICSYVFMPVAFMIGIPYKESFTVAKLIGTKLFLNEFVAYQALSALKTNRLNGLEQFVGGELQWLSVRSEIISTYSLCGFANFSSLGIMIGGLSSICPSRRGEISSMVLRAMLTATSVSLTNACVAGILVVTPVDCVTLFESFNATDVNIETCCQDLFQSTVNNGTISFEEPWNTVANTTVFFSKCCQYFGFSVPVCY
ncbi:Sodium/nucleoside cotransporter 1 [Dissostichus eleginoides]|uniref:Sodium/nucleoside cotransporter n=1 Tax=Dissostichus eleginoides TaxID=100907 RepID=A0AAD9BQW3_DISEL|nr:Sodium/nucleoside cotransporter 1 [Dissostichus eleginoides]